GAERFFIYASQAESGKFREYFRLLASIAGVYGIGIRKHSPVAREGYFSLVRRADHPSRCHHSAGLYAEPLCRGDGEADGLRREYEREHLQDLWVNLLPAPASHAHRQGHEPGGCLRYRPAAGHEGVGGKEDVS